MESDEALALFARHQRARGLSPRTVKRRSWSLGEWAAFLDPRMVAVATSEDVEEFLIRWPSPQTRHCVHSDLRMFYRWAMRREVAPADPTSDVDSPRVPRRTPTPIRREDVLRAVGTADGDVRLMILLGAFAGLRVSEIAVLCGRDVDYDRGLVVVRCGKNGKDREVPMSPELARALRSSPSGRLFPGLAGPGVSRRIKAQFVRCGIDARPHDLRSAFATQLSKRSNGNVVVVAQLLGHESVQTTQRYIGHSAATASLVVGLYDS